MCCLDRRSDCGARLPVDSTVKRRGSKGQTAGEKSLRMPTGDGEQKICMCVCVCVCVYNVRMYVLYMYGWM